MNKQKQKEPLSLMTVKTLLAVLLFAGLGTIIIGGGVVIMKYYNSEVNNRIVEPINQETENYYDVLEKKCGGDYDSCCLSSLDIMKQGNYKEADENGKCPDGFEMNTQKCWTTFRWCEPIEEDVSIITDKMEYEQGEEIKLIVKNNSGESICFESCNTYRFQKKNVVWEECFAKKCFVNFIAECIDYPEIKEFEDRLFKFNFERGTYRIVVPIYTGCQNEEFPCKENKTIYSNEFTIKEKLNNKRKFLMYDYQVDDKFLYFKEVKVGELAPNFDQYKEYGFYLTKNAVYCLDPSCNKRMEGSDSDTFIVLNWSYSKDENFVYYSQHKLYTAGNIIEGADPNSFDIISGRYARDKNGYYDQGKAVKEIPKEFMK